MSLVSEHLRRALVLAGSLVAMPALALQPMDDESMSSVTGQDGVQLDFRSNNPVAASNLFWMTDGTQPASPNTCLTAAPTGITANQAACTIVSNLSLTGVGTPLRALFDLDVGSSSAAAGGATGVSMKLDWDKLMLSMSGITLRTPTVNSTAFSLGSMAFVTDGYLHIVNRGGPMNANGSYVGYVDFSSSGDIIYRQGAAGQPEFSLGNFLLSNRFTNGAASGHTTGVGRIGLDDQGLIVDSPYAKADLLFDVMYKSQPTGYDTTGRSSITLFGWQGGLKDPSFRISAGGYAYGTSSASGAAINILDTTSSFTFQGGGARSEGLNLTTAWTFDTDFSWVIGQAGGNRTQVRFSNWVAMGNSVGTSPWLLMPITFDVIQENNPSTMGLCFGGGFLSGVPNQAGCTSAKGTLPGGTWIPTGVVAGKAAFATLIRDAHLWAYNTRVRIMPCVDVSCTAELPDTTTYPYYNWGLIYTYGKLDADLFMYPEGRGVGVTPTATANGIKLDATVMVQSPGFWERANSSSAAVRDTASANWSKNTHFMLADTAAVNLGGAKFGVGLVNADLVWQARDLYLRIVKTDAGYPEMPGGLWLQTDSKQRYFMRGMLGGGNLDTLGSAATPRPSVIALISLDLSTNRFLFVLSPVTPVNGDAPIGFDALLDFDGTASFSMAEASQPTAAFRLYNVSGRVGWKDGTVRLVSGINSPTTLPYLTLSNDLLFGSSADFGSGGGQPMIGNLGFGSESYGRIIMPGGIWHSEISLKIPST